jgi:hypothetical protein
MFRLCAHSSPGVIPRGLFRLAFLAYGLQSLLFGIRPFLGGTRKLHGFACADFFQFRRLAFGLGMARSLFQALALGNAARVIGDAELFFFRMPGAQQPGMFKLAADPGFGFHAHPLFRLSLCFNGIERTLLHARAFANESRQLACFPRLGRRSLCSLLLQFGGHPGLLRGGHGLFGSHACRVGFGIACDAQRPVCLFPCAQGIPALILCPQALLGFGASRLFSRQSLARRLQRFLCHGGTATFQLGFFLERGQ